MLQCMVVMQTRGSSKLSSTDRKNLILNLCRSLSVLHSPEEVADVLTDLLTPKEVETIAKRLQIAEYLAKNKEYHYIRQQLKVGYSTIARVNTWLNLSGEGFKLIFSRKKKSPKQETIEDKYDPLSWYNFKRRYSAYFWPQLLIEQLFRQSDIKEKKKIQKIYEKLQLKGRRFNAQENKKIYNMFSTKINLKSSSSGNQ